MRPRVEDVPTPTRRVADALVAAKVENQGGNADVHNIKIVGRRTSVRVEGLVWRLLNQVAAEEGRTVHELCAIVAAHRPDDKTLASALRTFLLAYFEERKKGGGKGRPKGKEAARRLPGEG